MNKLKNGKLLSVYIKTFCVICMLYVYVCVCIWFLDNVICILLEGNKWAFRHTYGQTRMNIHTYTDVQFIICENRYIIVCDIYVHVCAYVCLT